MTLAEWKRRHEAQLRAPHRRRAELAFLGDSITEAWCDSEPFQQAFARYLPLNLGIGGDQTQHLLWRMEQGALSNVHPKAAVVLIGVNNLNNGFTPTETVAGITSVVTLLQKLRPGIPTLLIAVLPSGRTLQDQERLNVQKTNQLLAEQVLPAPVRMANVGISMLEADGTIATDVMGDFLHPTELGYERLTRAVKPLVQQLLAGD